MNILWVLCASVYVYYVYVQMLCILVYLFGIRLLLYCVGTEVSVCAYDYKEVCVVGG